MRWIRLGRTWINIDRMLVVEATPQGSRIHFDTDLKVAIEDETPDQVMEHMKAMFL